MNSEMVFYAQDKITLFSNDLCLSHTDIKYLCARENMKIYTLQHRMNQIEQAGPQTGIPSFGGSPTKQSATHGGGADRFDIGSPISDPFGNPASPSAPPNGGQNPGPSHDPWTKPDPWARPQNPFQQNTPFNLRE